MHHSLDTSAIMCSSLHVQLILFRPVCSHGLRHSETQCRRWHSAGARTWCQEALRQLFTRHQHAPCCFVWTHPRNRALMVFAFMQIMSPFQRGFDYYVQAVGCPVRGMHDCMCSQAKSCVAS
jgi:hypothetical protein